MPKVYTMTILYNIYVQIGFKKTHSKPKMAKYF